MPGPGRCGPVFPPRGRRLQAEPPPRGRPGTHSPWLPGPASGPAAQTRSAAPARSAPTPLPCLPARGCPARRLPHGALDPEPEAIWEAVWSGCGPRHTAWPRGSGPRLGPGTERHPRSPTCSANATGSWVDSPSQAPEGPHRPPRSLRTPRNQGRAGQPAGAELVRLGRGWKRDERRVGWEQGSAFAALHWPRV